jgi:hypothetical protein
MTKNVTLRLDSSILRRCRQAAGAENMSISRWLEDLIANYLYRAEGFDAARKRALDYLQKGFDLGGKPLGREEAHAR